MKSENRVCLLYFLLIHLHGTSENDRTSQLPLRKKRQRCFTVSLCLQGDRGAEGLPGIPGQPGEDGISGQKVKPLTLKAFSVHEMINQANTFYFVQR